MDVHAEFYVEIEALTPTTIKWFDYAEEGRGVQIDEKELLTGENYEYDVIVGDLDLEGNIAKQIAQAIHDAENKDGYIKEGEIKLIGPYATPPNGLTRGRTILGRYWKSPDDSTYIEEIENTEELIEAINGYLSGTPTKLPTNHIINWNQKLDFVFPWPRNITSTHSVNISDPDEPDQWEEY